jgi:hypothetical protein
LWSEEGKVGGLFIKLVHPALCVQGIGHSLQYQARDRCRFMQSSGPWYSHRREQREGVLGNLLESQSSCGIEVRSNLRPFVSRTHYIFPAGHLYLLGLGFLWRRTLEQRGRLEKAHNGLEDICLA